MKIIFGVLISLLFLSVFAYADAPEDTRQKEIQHLIRHDCGSCHGLTRKGGLGPDLLPERLQTIAADALFATIKFGRPGTPMPPWQDFFTDDEIHWIVEQLQEGRE
ncbi:MAG: cytochrome c [Hahellaceae bacterium]|nr:cytochrome c [Hahellaceae bacterium]